MIDYTINKKGFVCIECPRCGQISVIPITESELLQWEESEEFIQDYFPNLSSSQRELLLSGICQDCWNLIFPEEDEY